MRLKSLVNLFDNYHSIPVEDLLSKPTVIELAAIENSDQKALIISLLLLSILAYVNANYPGDGKLKNIILLEEAHVLLSAVSQSEDANPSAIAQNLVKRMLAEIRSYGVGIAIADQSPKKVTSEVVALTDLKLAFRLVEAQDKQIIADSMNMEEVQMKRLGRLKPGEAFLFFGKLEEPEEVSIPDYRAQKDISITITDKKIQQLSTYWNDKEPMLIPYPECSYVTSCSNACNYDRRILGREIARRIFVKYCRPSMNSIDQIKPVFQYMTKLVMAELNGEEFSKELLLCVKCQLFRRIRYGTQIPIEAKLFGKKDFLYRGKLNALGKGVGSTLGGMAVGTAAGCGIGIAAGAVVVGGLAIGMPVGFAVGGLIGFVIPGLNYRAKAGDKINIQLLEDLNIQK